MTSHIMLDLETMSTAPNAAIVAIGAARFQPYTKEILGTYYTAVTLKSSMQAGLHVDPDTLMWWLKQDEQAKKAILSPDAVSIQHALFGLNKFLEGSNDIVVWGNGATFDNVIIRSAYTACSMEAPWKFWNDKCYRTIKSLYPDIALKREGIHHHALDDAISQAKHLIEIVNIKGLKI